MWERVGHHKRADTDLEVDEKSSEVAMVIEFQISVL